MTMQTTAGVHDEALADMERELLARQARHEVQVELDEVLGMISDYCITARLTTAQLPPALQCVNDDAHARYKRLHSADASQREREGCQAFALNGLFNSLERARGEVA